MVEKITHLHRLLRHRTGLGLILFLALLTLAFLQPILFPPSHQAAGGADVRGLFLPWLDFARNALAQGRLPLWDPYHFGGYPFLSNPQVALFYPLTWLAWIAPVNVAISWHIAFHIWLLGSGMLLYLRQEGSGWTPALLGATSLGFSGFVAARVFAGHTGMLATFAWLPWLLLAFNWAERRHRWWAAVLAGVPLGLAILAGHTTSLLYVGIIWLATAVYRCLQRESLRPLGILFLSAVAGTALSAVQLVPLLQVALKSSRAANAGLDAATDFSLPPAHLITLLMPEYFGEPTRIGYWSVPVFEEFAYYTGILSVVGLILAIRKSTGRTWLYLVLAVTGLWLALGRYTFLYERVYDWFPVFRLARAPARAAILFTFASSVLLAHTTTHWQRHFAPQALAQTLRRVLAVGLAGGMAGLGATGALFALQHVSPNSGRLWHQLGGWSWLLLMLTLSCALLWAWLGSRASGSRRWLAQAALVVLLIADLWHFGHKLVRLEDTAPATLWSVAREIIGQSEERVLPWGVSIFEQNGAGQVGLRSVFGYNALAPGPAEALTSSVPDPRSTAYDLLSVRYVVAPVPLDKFTDGQRPLQLEAKESGAWIYRRARVMPVVRLVYEAEVIPDQETAIRRVHDPDFEPSNTAIVEREPECALPGQQPAQPGDARLLEHEETFWRIETSSVTPALLVVSESMHSGWRVTIDGQPAQPLTAYTTLRAVCVPAGQHVVNWRFSPSLYWLGAALTLLAIGTMLVALFLLRRERASTGRSQAAI